MTFHHLQGPRDYATVHAWMSGRVDSRARGEVGDLVLLLEHQPVVTAGRGGAVPDGAISVERGGDVTWHGPGQLVAYPILALEGAKRDLHRHLRALEQAVIDVLSAAGLPAVRDPRNTGVWLEMPLGPPRKVCSIGVACRRWVTWHGLALNLTPSMAEFGQINPCGFAPSVMTRVADHLPDCPPLAAWVEPLAMALAGRLEVPFDGILAGEL